MATDLGQTGQITDERLDNGLRVVIEVMPDASSAATGLYARAGSRDEPREWAGVSHFLEHMCFKGTRRRPWRQITIDFDDMGATYNAYTGKESTVYFGWVRQGDVARQIELLADLVQPTLPADQFELERKVVLEEIAMAGDDLDSRVNDLLHEKVFAGHPLAWPVLGYKETIERLTRDQMADYQATFYSPGNMTLIVAGHVAPEAVLRIAREVTADWVDAGRRPQRQSPPALRTGAATQVLNRFNQQCVAVAQACGPAGAGQEHIEAISQVLGGENSRFFWNITQKGLSPRSGVWGVAYTDCGFQMLHAFGEPDGAEGMVEAMHREAARLQANGPTPDELGRYKNRRRTGLAADGEAAYQRLMQIMHDIEYHDRPRTLEERLARVEALTVSGVREYLGRWPIAGEGFLLSVGPRAWPERSP